MVWSLANLLVTFDMPASLPHLNGHLVLPTSLSSLGYTSCSVYFGQGRLSTLFNLKDIFRALWRVAEALQRNCWVISDGLDLKPTTPTPPPRPRPRPRARSTHKIHGTSLVSPSQAPPPPPLPPRPPPYAAIS